MKKTISKKEFIEKVILRDIRRVVYEDKNPYIAFVLVLLGVRFIKNIAPMPEKYVGLNELAESMLSSFLPSEKFELTHRKEAEQESITHLQEKDGKTCLILEDLYDDLEMVSKKVMGDVGGLDVSFLEMT